MDRFKTAGRWLLVLPAAIIGAGLAKIVTEWTWVFTDPILGAIFPMAIIGYVLSEGVVAPIAFIWSGAKTAPSRHNSVATVLACLYAAYCATLLVSIWVVLGDRTWDWLLHTTGTISVIDAPERDVPQLVVFSTGPLGLIVSIWAAIGTKFRHWQWAEASLAQPQSTRAELTTVDLMAALQASLDAPKQQAAEAEQARKVNLLRQALRHVGCSDDYANSLIGGADKATLHELAERIAAATAISTWTSQEQRAFLSLAELLLKQPQPETRIEQAGAAE